MHAIIVLVCCALEGQWDHHSTLSILLLLHISKPHVDQSLSMRLPNYTCAKTHTCQNGGYHFFTRLYPVVISNSISVSECWHKYPMLTLSSISQSSALILLHVKSIILILLIVQALSIVTGTSD